MINYMCSFVTTTLVYKQTNSIVKQGGSTFRCQRVIAGSMFRIPLLGYNQIWTAITSEVPVMLNTALIVGNRFSRASPLILRGGEGQKRHVIPREWNVNG